MEPVSQNETKIGEIRTESLPVLEYPLLLSQVEPPWENRTTVAPCDFTEYTSDLGEKSSTPE